MLQCCFRIGLESTLPILLRQMAESVIMDMARFLHISLGSFEQDIRPCLKELLRFCLQFVGNVYISLLNRFLTALINPLERTNTEQMILMGLNLLAVVFEVGSEYIRNYESLLPVICDDLSRVNKAFKYFSKD